GRRAGACDRRGASRTGRSCVVLWVGLVEVAGDGLEAGLLVGGEGLFVAAGAGPHAAGFGAGVVAPAPAEGDAEEAADGHGDDEVHGCSPSCHAPATGRSVPMQTARHGQSGGQPRAVVVSGVSSARRRGPAPGSCASVVMARCRLSPYSPRMRSAMHRAAVWAVVGSRSEEHTSE